MEGQVRCRYNQNLFGLVPVYLRSFRQPKLSTVEKVKPKEDSGYCVTNPLFWSAEQRQETRADINPEGQ